MRNFGTVWITRFAPAPTGYLHLGHVVNALYVWGVTRARGGQVLLRIEDHDRGRCTTDYEQALVNDLAWLGFTPDTIVPKQSERDARYTAALAQLHALRLTYPCDCSRRDIARDVPDVPHEEMRYPGRCRSRALSPDITPARRVRMDVNAAHEPDRREEMFIDERLGPQRQVPAAQCGDLLVRDRHGQWTYQFAVTVDDFDQGVNLVIRGEDLLTSTGRQLRLARLLGRAEPPAFLHHPLLRKAGGEKLSKSNGDTGVRALRAAYGTRGAARVIGLAAYQAGLQNDARPIVADDVPELFIAGVKP